MNYINAILACEFRTEINLMNEYMYTKIPEGLTPNNYDTLNDDHMKMAEEVGAICQSLKRSYQLKVVVYKFAEPELNEF